jgi:histidine ammonia-lyase
MAYDLVRQNVPFLENDAIMYPYINTIRDLVADGRLTRSVARALREE